MRSTCEPIQAIGTEVGMPDRSLAPNETIGPQVISTRPIVGLPIGGRNPRRLVCEVMAQVVLRVRLTGGDHIDVSYEGSEADPDAVIERVIAALAQDTGVLRTRHGDRLVVLYGRGVAAVEVAPRGAVL